MTVGETAHMTPEWVSFRNEFRSRMKFVLHSHDIITRLSLRCSRARGFRARSKTKWRTFVVRLWPQTTRFAVSSRNGVRFQFTWYQNEMSYQNENFIRIENRNDLCGNQISSRYHINRCREIYGDGMNSFWNKSHSGIMWTAPHPRIKFARGDGGLFDWLSGLERQFWKSL